MDELLDIQFLAKHTIPVTSLVYYPFFTVTLMVVARLSWFDGWTWPFILLFIFGFQLLALVSCVVALRSTAEATRKRAIQISRKSLWELKRQNSGIKEREERSGTIEMVKDVIKELEEIKSGSLESVSRQPLLKAILLPSGSAGIIALLAVFASNLGRARVYGLLM